jgi:flagellar hook-length control protein FliK
MTSSNVTNLLVQVSQVDVSVTSDKTTAQSQNGLFEKTLINVANKVPSVDPNKNSTVPESKTNIKTRGVDTPKEGISVNQESKPQETYPQVVEKVEAVVEEVKEVIKDQLDVTDEDIQQAMENLGLTFIDLLNPQSLAQLVSELTGETESISLVLSDDFAGILDKVTELTNQLFEETNNSFIQLKDLVEQVTKEQVDLAEVSEIPEADIIPETFETKGQVVTEEVQTDNQESLAPIVQENSNTAVKQEAVVEKENVVAMEAQEDIKPAVTEIKQQNPDTESEKKEESQDNFKMPEKAQNESFVSRGENMIFAQQNNEIQFTPETSVVTLPTGETVKAEDIANQLIEQAKVMTDSEATTMEMTLNPEGLGKIFLQVTQKGDEITAKIFTENDAVKQALENQMASLRTEMNQSNTKVTSIEVSVGAHEFERNLDENARDNSSNQEQASKQSAKRNSRINLNSLDELTGLMSDEDMLIAQMMKDNGGTLDFMA